MNNQLSTKFLLDSGDPDEFREIAKLAKENGSELWGATTNPTLIAKKLAGPSATLRVNKKISKEEAYELQKQIVLEIIDIVPGAVSAEVYADEKTTAQEMIQQGKDIATWHERVIVKLPTTIEGFKARSVLRKEKIQINNTLVFSQEQIFAICLHERIIQKEYGLVKDPELAEGPCFISPFVGRLDDIGIDGMQLVEHGMKMKATYGFDCWMLEASVRNREHMQRGINCKTELITAPAKVYREWFPNISDKRKEISNKAYAKELQQIPYWEPPKELLTIETEEAFFEAISAGKLNINHNLTDTGITRFAKDWQAIIK